MLWQLSSCNEHATLNPDSNPENPDSHVSLRQCWLLNILGEREDSGGEGEDQSFHCAGQCDRSSHRYPCRAHEQSRPARGCEQECESLLQGKSFVREFLLCIGKMRQNEAWITVSSWIEHWKPGVFLLNHVFFSLKDPNNHLATFTVPTKLWGYFCFPSDPGIVSQGQASLVSVSCDVEVKLVDSTLVFHEDFS